MLSRTEEQAAKGPSRAIRLTGGGEGLNAHPLRDRVANELHARPFEAVDTPRRIYHLAFLTDSAAAAEDRDQVTAFCESHGVQPPDPDSKHHRITLGATSLRWEQHTEFTTYSWESSENARSAFSHPILSDAPFKDMPPPPGPVIGAVHLALVHEDDAPPLESVFDRTSLCVSVLHGGIARAATDFRQDAYGYTRVLVIDKGMRPERAGTVVQRLLEIEVYRTLALLGLPEVERIRPQISRIETELNDYVMDPHDGSLEDNRTLLDRLIALGTEVESILAASDYRFSATDAYDAIVDLRLQSIHEEGMSGYSRWSSFLARRMKPAIATCQSTRSRLSALSSKLARAADLLRTRVDIDIEQQNRDLLKSMDTRAKLQLRLQQTVEGLSVAAVSYYIVGLVSYVLSGTDVFGLPVSVPVATAISVPLVIGFVWWTVRRIRKMNREKGTSAAQEPRFEP
ncbi:MAG: DUF3422 domain-containing protein [Pseudomonadota bacterium]